VAMCFGPKVRAQSTASTIYINCVNYSCSPDIGVGINAAIAGLPNGGAVVLPTSGSYTDSTNVAVPKGIVLSASGNAIITITTGVTFTFTGKLDAPRVSLFAESGTGAVIFNPGSVDAVYPEWFGAKGDGTTDDHVAIQEAWNADLVSRVQSAPLSFGCTNYLIEANLNFTNADNWTLRGCAASGGGSNIGQTNLQVNFTGSNTVGIDVSAGVFANIRDLQVNCGTSVANAPTVCWLDARATTGFNRLDYAYNGVTFNGYSPWIYYGYRNEQTTWDDVQWSELATTGTPLTISGVNTAGITSPNVTLGGFDSCTGFIFKGSVTTINSFATTSGSKLLYLDEGSEFNIASVWGEVSFIQQSANETDIADTSGATGGTADVRLRILGNTNVAANLIANVTGAANNWQLDGQMESAMTSTPFNFGSFTQSDLQFVTNSSNATCFTSTDANKSYIVLDHGGCATITAPNATFTSGSSSTLLLKGIGQSSTFVANQGSACTNGELALSAGWGTSPTVTAVAGTGQTCEWTITSGTGTPTANPTITDTLTNALPSAATVCRASLIATASPAIAPVDQTTLSATAPVFTAYLTPGTSTAYKFSRTCGP